MTREEFDRWVGRHRPRLVMIALKVCGRWAAADAVQDAVVSIYTHATYRGIRTGAGANPVAYVGRIVTRCASNARQAHTSRTQRQGAFARFERLQRAARHDDFGADGPVAPEDSGIPDERGKRTSPARRVD